MYLIACVLSVFLIACSQIASASNQRNAEDQFISIADIHFDPLSGCKTSIRACPLLAKLRAADYQQWDAIFEQFGPKKVAKLTGDTNYPLLKSLLIKLQEINNSEHPQFGIIPGDFLAHDFRFRFLVYAKDFSSADYRAFVKKTLQYLTYKIRLALPDIDLYPAIGNNDSYTGDYSVIPNGSFLEDAANIWSQLILNKENRESFLHDFPEDGYYSITVPNNQFQRIIVLNTVLFSAKLSSSKMTAVANQELVWLQRQLILTANLKQRALLVFHIPVGIDMYSTWKGHFGTIVEYWQDSYSKLFQSEVKDFSAQISAILPAHIHIDSFRFVSLRKIDNVPIIFTPAVSPIFGNAPSFRVFSYNPTNFKIIGFTTYSLGQNNQWHKD